MDAAVEAFRRQLQLRVPGYTALPSSAQQSLLAEIQDRQINPSNDWKNGGSYSYSETVEIDVHFETFQSLEAKLNLYAQRPIRGVAFWRIGQEPPGFWEKAFK